MNKVASLQYHAAHVQPAWRAKDVYLFPCALNWELVSILVIKDPRLLEQNLVRLDATRTLHTVGHLGCKLQVGFVAVTDVAMGEQVCCTQNIARTCSPLSFTVENTHTQHQALPMLADTF